MRSLDRAKPVHHKPRASLIAIAALTAALPAHSQLDGLTLEKWCKSESLNYQGACAMYWRGMADASYLWQLWNDSHGQEKLHCAPFQDGEVTQRVWLKYIEENPEKLGVPPGISYLEAMQETYPCED